jgi:formylglycine-generating enzyme
MSLSNHIIDLPEMTPSFAPVWAGVFGEDQYGVFAEFCLDRVRFVWRWIPPGQFLMGSPDSEQGRDDDEGPQHHVIISRGFWIGETPVTQEQWEIVMGTNPSRFPGRDHPVENVSWHDCHNFVQNINQLVLDLKAALPTEAQWEYACRAGTQGAFHIDGSVFMKPQGKDPILDQIGWFDSNSRKTTHPVKQKAANKWGLYDMHGNVWEWCRDGMRKYTATPQVNPAGDTSEGDNRVVRGGSWVDRAQCCRAAYRNRRHPGYGWGALGLRLFAGQVSGHEGAEPTKSADS